MLRPLFARRFSKPTALDFLLRFSQYRELHSRNRKAMELIAKGWSALKEVDRVIDYCELNDRRLIPLLRTAKENFELALEIDNSNTHAKYWLSKLHLKYHVPGGCKAIGAALLVEAADMGDPDAQYELGCRLRVENKYVQSDQQAFYYLEKAVDQGHAGAAIAYGSLLLKGIGVPESLTKFSLKKGSSTSKARKNPDGPEMSPVEMAREQFNAAAISGSDLGLKWLNRLEEEERSLLTESE